MWLRTPAPVRPVPTSALLGRWAQAQGAQVQAHGDGWSLRDPSSALPWALDAGPAAASVIATPGLRGGSARQLPAEPLVVLVERRTRLRLESQAWASATGSLHTSVDARIPDELLWMAGGRELGWDGPPRDLWSAWSVLAAHRAEARLWLDGPLLQAAQCWHALTDGAPLLLALQGGAVHLRAADLGGRAQVAAAEILALACARAAACFAVPRPVAPALDLVL